MSPLKSLALLLELLQRPLEVVTKDELFQQVWPRTVVTEAALRSCIRELRQVLHDDARKPRFIETVHRVGFRFLQNCSSERNQDATNHLHRPGQIPLSRDGNLNRLLQACDQAEGGHTQIVLVEDAALAIEAAVIERLVEAIGREKSWALGVGAASSTAGPLMSYQPVLQCIRSLCMSRGGLRNFADLRRLAPSCLAEIEDLLD